jgi:hypothetical protein
MSLLEDHTASFIVRIWRESGDAPGAHGDWRGSIEHVPSGHRAFFRDLGAIVTFMKPHLSELGIDPASRFWELMSSDEVPGSANALPQAPRLQGDAPPARRKKPLR